MATQFDPYYKWLGIPPTEQPPNHYRLLAVNLFECDPDVIESAADQRMVHLRTFQTGQHADLSQRLLNEIAAAKLCLLKPDRRAKYDEALQARLGQAAALSAASALPQTQPIPQQQPALQAAYQASGPVFEEAVDEVPAQGAAWQHHATDPYDFTSGAGPASVTLPRRRKSKLPLVMAIGGPFLAIIVTIVAINIVNSNQEEDERNEQSQNVAAANTSSSAAITHPDDKHKTGDPTHGGKTPGNKTGADAPAAGRTWTSGSQRNNGSNFPPHVAGDSTHAGSQDVATSTSTGNPPIQTDPDNARAGSGDPVNPPLGVNDKGLLDNFPTDNPDKTPSGDKPFGPAPNSNNPNGAKPLAPARTPVPSAEAQRKALAQLKQVLKEDYTQAKGAEGSLALARKLEGIAREKSDDAASRYVMAKEGLEMAIKFCDPRLASEFVGGISQNFDVDSWDLKSHTLVQLCQTAKTAETRALLAKAAYDLIEKALGAGRYDNAVELATASANLATAIKDPALHEQARQIGERARRLQKQAHDFDVASQTLATSPDDVDANLVVGRFECFLQGDWDAGLPQLVKGSDGPLHDVAMQELKFPPTDAAAQMKVADLWWDLADKTEKHDELWGKAYRARAAHWYQMAVPSLTGLAAIKAQKRINEAKGTSTPTPHGSTRG